MEQSIQILRQRIKTRAARRQLRAPVLGAVLVIGSAVAFYGTLYAVFF